MTAVAEAGRHARGGLLRPAAAWVPVAVCNAVYVLAQSGGPTLEAERTIDFRCTSEEYGLVPAELAHPGRRATDVFCEPGESAEDDGHGHERSDARMPADAPAAITPLTWMVMHGSALHLALTMLVAAALDLGQPVAGAGGGIAYWVPLAGGAAGWLVARGMRR